MRTIFSPDFLPISTVPTTYTVVVFAQPIITLFPLSFFSVYFPLCRQIPSLLLNPPFFFFDQYKEAQAMLDLECYQRQSIAISSSHQGWGERGGACQEFLLFISKHKSQKLLIIPRCGNFLFFTCSLDPFFVISPSRVPCATDIKRKKTWREIWECGTHASFSLPGFHAAAAGFFYFLLPQFLPASPTPSTKKEWGAEMAWKRKS